MVTVVWQIWSMRHFFDCLPYEWRSGTSDGIFLPIYPPRSMHVVLGFWWLVDFCNKYVSSLWLMLSPWIIHTLTLPSLLASLVSCIALSHLESWCKLHGASKPRDMIHSITHKPPYIFLKTATVPTYYGISIAIPRYIAMQLSTVPLLWHASSLSYCLHDHVVDIVFVARPPFIILHTCHSCIIAHPDKPPEAFT